MAETLGSLCDKLTILILKAWHSRDTEQLKNIELQQRLLRQEIDDYLRDAVNKRIPLEYISLPANKVYKKEGNTIREFHGKIGDIIGQLAEVNCKLWHQQEKVYEFEKVPPEEKDAVIKGLAILNLERNQCIDAINAQLYTLIQNIK
ncbi:MAG TPA: hypothetical protein PLC07_06110 [Bacillota bacterium]|nr:hypothetical protein [Bacillota bacterium]HPT86970.1 hypothetical protein [Bacillota bacterium]